MRLRYGTHRPLEDAADALLAQSLAGVTSRNAKADILTPWKERDRRSREVMVPSGTPDQSIRKGIWHRALNTRRPDLNARVTPGGRGRSDRPGAAPAPSLRDFLGLDGDG